MSDYVQIRVTGSARVSDELLDSAIHALSVGDSIHALILIRDEVHRARGRETDLLAAAAIAAKALRQAATLLRFAGHHSAADEVMASLAALTDEKHALREAP